MAIRPRCNSCAQEFATFGGLFFYKPLPEPGVIIALGRRKKMHLCVERGCYDRIRKLSNFVAEDKCGLCSCTLTGRKSQLISPPDRKDEVEEIEFCDSCSTRIKQAIAA